MPLWVHHGVPIVASYTTLAALFCLVRCPACQYDHLFEVRIYLLCFFLFGLWLMPSVLVCSFFLFESLVGNVWDNGCFYGDLVLKFLDEMSLISGTLTPCLAPNDTRFSLTRILAVFTPETLFWTLRFSGQGFLVMQI